MIAGPEYNVTNHYTKHETQTNPTKLWNPKPLRSLL